MSFEDLFYALIFGHVHYLSSDISTRPQWLLPILPGLYIK